MFSIFCVRNNFSSLFRDFVCCAHQVRSCVSWDMALDIDKEVFTLYIRDCGKNSKNMPRICTDKNRDFEYFSYSYQKQYATPHLLSLNIDMTCGTNAADVEFYKNHFFSMRRCFLTSLVT